MNHNDQNNRDPARPADSQQSQSQSGGQQSQSGSDRNGQQGEMHPGSDRDDYGAPGNDSGRVGHKQYEQDRGESGGEWQDGEGQRANPDQQEQAEPGRDSAMDRERREPGRDSQMEQDSDYRSNNDGPLDE